MALPSRDIYFCGAIRGGRQDVAIYGQIVRALRRYGNVLTEFVADPNVTDMEPHQGEISFDRDIHDQDLELMRRSDCVVAECTQTSLGVGYEVGRAMALQRRILILYRPQPGKRLSAMIRGLPPPNAMVVEYELHQLDDILSRFFSRENSRNECSNAVQAI